MMQDDGFVFDVYDGNRAKNQERYEKIGKIMDKVIFEFLQTKAGLRKMAVGPQEPKSFVFADPDFGEKKRLMVLIHGAPPVRAGQWTRKLIINEGLRQGTQLPFVEKARQMGFAVLVTNTNLHHVDDDETLAKFPGSETAQKHAKTVWESMILPAKAEQIAIVAHSFGGVVTCALANAFKQDFEKRVISVALTDSVHSTADVTRHLRQVGLNYVAYTDPPGTEIKSRFLKEGDIPAASAGHDKHEWTSYSAMEHIFRRLQKQLEQSKDEL